MTVHRVEVESLGALAEAMGELAEDWRDIAKECLIEALVTSGYLKAVYERTPRSSRERYAAARDGSVLRVTGRGRDGDPGSWTATLRTGWEDRLRRRGVSQDAIDRLNEYGIGNLANSLIPNGNVMDDTIFGVRTSRDSVELSISSSVPYAARIHEAEKPAEGEYWTPGRDRGWSAGGTGNRYLERPYEELQDRILERFTEAMDREMRERGLL